MPKQIFTNPKRVIFFLEEEDKGLCQKIARAHGMDASTYIRCALKRQLYEDRMLASNRMSPRSFFAG
jgi:hypothetical protein